MKKFFVILFLFASVCAFAQSPGRIEILIGGGGGSFLPIPRMTDEPHEKLGYSITPEVRYSFLDWLTVGVDAGFEVKGSEKSLSMGLGVFSNWLTRGSVRLYSGIGYKVLPNLPSFEDGIHLTPIGCSFGNKFFGFAELGAGSQFFPARAGIGYRFSGNKKK